MAVTAEALFPEERPTRPHLKVVVNHDGRPDRHRPARPRLVARRLVVRRRLVLLAIVAATAFATGLAAASLPARDVGQEPSTPGSVTADVAARGDEVTVVVAPGDTLWDLARKHLPEGRPPAEYVADILAANDLDPTALRPGTVVRLPPG